MAVLISSDWHFNHQYDNEVGGILEFERKNKFSTIEAHDAYIVKCIRKWIASLKYDSDTFYFLGDFGRPTEETFKQLKGIFYTAKCHTIAVLGNHDHSDEILQLNELFDYVESYPVWLSNRVVLSHQPVAVWKDQLNIHGHLHGSVLDSPNHLNASVHVANYQAVNKSKIESALSKISKYNRRFLYEPWADMYKFTQKKDNIIYDKDRKIDLSATRLFHRLLEEKQCDSR